MASGPQHYAQANEVLDRLAQVMNHAAEAGVPVSEHSRSWMLQLAQVHATLALAAAQALETTGDPDMLEREARAWGRATAPTLPPPTEEE